MAIFSGDGEFLSSWGAGLFGDPHAIRVIRENGEDRLWIADRHLGQFMKFTTDGRLLTTLGTRGYRSDTGIPPDDFTSVGWKKVTHAGPPFNMPTDIVIAPSGEMFTSDGYGNARVHKFSADGKLLFSWGEPGAAPGQFHLPHGVWIDRHGRLLVADRENNRVQVFDQQGKLLTIWPTELIGPAFFYVDDVVYIAEHNSGTVSILTLNGERLARWGGPEYFACHGVWGDSRGDLFVVQPGAWGPGRRVVKYARQ